MSKERELLEKVMAWNDEAILGSRIGYLDPVLAGEIKAYLFCNKLESLPFPSPAFANAWQAWETHRKEKRHKLTPTTRERQLAKCREWGEVRAIAAINHSIEAGYQGLFEPSKPMIQQQVLVKARKDFGY